jgi:CTP:molybdopterin cytidylyltransferase MocA
MDTTSTTLVILAAGMASRYGSVKQIQGFGPGGETLMDYSIYDAIRSGFTKIVFIIRRSLKTTSNKFLNPN